MVEFRRKTPEEFLQTIYKVKRGRLKIILGAASGSGKTYHMLVDGNVLKKKSIDVVIGLISPSNRPKTIEQIGDLEAIRAIEWVDNGIVKQDLDIDAIKERNPEVVLVDILSHRNRPDAPHKTRFDDVLELMNHNISVITTMNIYELSGVREIVENMLGVKVQVDHCVPDDTLAIADEVKLLDVTPDQILNRLQKGGLDRALRDKLFKRDHLAILRELALRHLAGEVNDELDDYREQQGLIGPSGASERILVTVQYHWNGSILVRRGQQIAKRLGGELVVVCFLSADKKLSKEEETFRRSIKKLVHKVGGEFEEFSLTRTDAAEEIVSYATDMKITKIVIGHSKRGRLEEIINGSVINKILRKTQNIDIFVVADRTDKNGKRVIPAKWRDENKVNPYRRLSKKEVEEQISKIKRGQLKLYIGAAPGVGKTYTMLREANVLKDSGIDIVIGLLETHGRKETVEQVGSLEIIPREIINYKNVEIEEMDVGAIIKRNPEVVLVDELAHTNVSGSIHKKRYEDVEAIIKSGISVISTMNIQHLESLNDSIEQITGVRVRETVPDHILRMADEIELIDISPKELQQRMLEGNIYAKEKIEQALNNFFKTYNLIALRELALREVADDVDERLESLERKHTLRGPWRKQESIFVCVNLRGNSERLIRRGFRTAYRLKANWYVGYVKDHSVLTDEEQSKIKNLQFLTERLGGVFEMYETSHRRKVVEELVERLNDKDATQVFIGQSTRTRMEEIIRGSIVQKLLRLVRHLDVLIVADQKPDKKKSTG